MSEKTVLACEGVRSGYGSIEVIRGLDLYVDKGDVYALIGKNGAGKTTLLRTIIGTIGLRGGTVTVLGQDVSRWQTHKRMQMSLSCTPQDNALFQDLSVGTNLRLGCLRLNARQYKDALKRAVEMFPFIAERINQKAGTLSGGEQGMVKLARAIMPQPDLLLLDEITEGLNPIVVNRAIEIIQSERHDRGITVLLIEQHVDFIMQLATRYALIDKGVITGYGSMAEKEAESQITQHLLI